MRCRAPVSAILLPLDIPHLVLTSAKKVGMELLHPFAVLELVLSGEYLLVRKLAVLDWQKRTVDVRVQLVEMYNEAAMFCSPYLRLTNE